MKEMGESFRNARETIGISLEEACKDLIRKYSRYLNLDEESNIDKFNEFIFSYTSKIPVEEILEQTREINILESQNVINLKNQIERNQRNQSSNDECEC